MTTKWAQIKLSLAVTCQAMNFKERERQYTNSTNSNRINICQRLHNVILNDTVFKHGLLLSTEDNFWLKIAVSLGNTLTQRGIKFKYVMDAMKYSYTSYPKGGYSFLNCLYKEYEAKTQLAHAICLLYIPFQIVTKTSHQPNKIFISYDICIGSC